MTRFIKKRVDMLEKGILEIQINENFYGIPVSFVKRVIRAVEVKPVPDKRLNWLGLINIQGEVMPVLSLSRWIGAREKEIELKDRFIIIRASENRSAALWVDAVGEVLSIGWLASSTLPQREEVLLSLNTVVMFEISGERYECPARIGR